MQAAFFASIHLYPKPVVCTSISISISTSILISIRIQSHFERCSVYYKGMYNVNVNICVRINIHNRTHTSRSAHSGWQKHRDYGDHSGGR